MKKRNIIQGILNITLIVFLIVTFVFAIIRIDHKIDEESKNKLTLDSENKIVSNANSYHEVSYNNTINGANETKVQETFDNNTIKNSVPTYNEKPFSAITIDYFPSYKDLFMMCVVVSSETGYCDEKVQKAVAHTIINRVNSDKFPNTIEEVVTQRNQYTAIHSYFDGNYRKYLEPHSALWNKSWNICWEALNEPDFIGGAVAYYNPYQKGVNPWFEQFTLTYEDEFGRFFIV